MQITISEHEHYIQIAHIAGYSDLESYVIDLLEREAEKVAILEALKSVDEGDVMEFSEFDREFRLKHGIPLRS